MAPLPPQRGPSARTLRAQRITGQIHPLLPSKVFRPGAHVSDAFLRSKRDKRLIKHSSFVSQIASTSGKIAKVKSRPRRRRPKNKLTSLDGLADALPELDTGGVVAAGKIRHRSLGSNRGALKRKERIVRGEMDRFGASLANLAKVQQDTAEAGDEGREGMQTPDLAQRTAPKSLNAAVISCDTSNRWAALRGYISSTMEQNPAFAGK